MATDFQRRMAAITAKPTQVDEGLRAYMLRVYNYMAVGLALTGIVAFLTASTPPLLQAIHGTLLQWVVFLAPLGMVFFLSARIHKMSVGAAQTTYWLFAAIMGLSLSSIFIIYTATSITEVFFITAASFAGLSLYGYTTKRDLSGLGSFLFMGLIGIIIAMVVNIFLGSAMLNFVISVLGVLIFAGLTAYDTQAIKQMYYEADGDAIAAKKSIMGALRLYLDFINMFIFMLHLFGSQR